MQWAQWATENQGGGSTPCTLQKTRWSSWIQNPLESLQTSCFTQTTQTVLFFSLSLQAKRSVLVCLQPGSGGSGGSGGGEQRSRSLPQLSAACVRAPPCWPHGNISGDPTQTRDRILRNASPLTSDPIDLTPHPQPPLRLKLDSPMECSDHVAFSRTSVCLPVSAGQSDSSTPASALRKIYRQDTGRRNHTHPAGCRTDKPDDILILRGCHNTNIPRTEKLWPSCGSLLFLEL